MNLNSAWNYLAHHRDEIIWAAFFALVFAVALDVFSPDSRIRAAIRHLRNRWSEHSISLLERRIRQLEVYQKQLTDSRWQYLVAFQILFIILLGFSLGTTFWILSDLREFRARPRLDDLLVILTLYCFSATGGIATTGFRHVFRDSPEKMKALVAAVGLEIESLQKKLRARPRRDTN